ncbi:hypothetical protein EKO27_g1350 [Xylaria grammica]|uniref:BZIP domain-containing protein n=1 Tax=Xylaria grammica TaxID=363999 RepID=A0A439DH81_9PEZI|nr:hypothetical protein EKO27_g1350 [Xylaria grammica]
MMNGGIFIGQSLQDNTRALNYPLYGALSESEEPPTLEFGWAHQEEEARYDPRQNLRNPAKETWAGSTDLGLYMSTNNEFNSGFELDGDPEEPALFAQGRTMVHPINTTTSLNTADFISDQQNYRAETYEAIPSEPSPASTASTSKSPVTSMDSTRVPDIKHHRERNRVAARKCRQKAKLNFAGLQRRERELSQQNKLLHSHVGGLREEVLDLKNEILRHSDCNSSVIQDYIANAARRQLG